MIPKTRVLIKTISKEAYVIPIILSLFLIPLFWNPSFIHAFTQGKELIFKIIILFTFTVSGICLLFKKSFELKKIINSILFLLLLIQINIFTITNILSNTPTITLYGTYSRGFGFIIELFLFAFLVYCALTLSQKTIIKSLKIAFLGSILVSIYAILQKLGTDPFFTNYSINIFAGRAFSFLGNPSYLGQFMLLQTIIGGFLTITTQKSPLKYIFATGTILAISTLLASETRTALFGLIMVTILITIKYTKYIIHFIRTHKKIVLLAIIVISLTVITLPKDRYSLSDISMRSLNSRIEIWNGTLDLIKKRPIFGYGGETFYIHFPEIITKKFLTLEENINISADRTHNEVLEILFSHGIFALLTYLTILAFLLKTFFKSRNKTKITLILLIIATTIQNQFAFPDISISILTAFCFGGIISLRKEKKINISLSKYQRLLAGTTLIFFSLLLSYITVLRPWMSQIAYSTSKENYNTNYTIAINNHKKAIYYTPYYSELWYELMFIDPSSTERALHYLEQIENNSGNVLAWKGNFYSSTDPEKASEFYIKALEKNPHHPNWIRAFADMLYKQEDYENALFLYDKYLKSIPDFWEWKDELDQHSPIEQKSYESLIKQTPYLWGVIEKINKITEIINKKPETSKPESEYLLPESND